MTARSPILIEVCVDSVESTYNAVRAGADRLELCSNLGLGGGTTPSLGLLKAVQKVANSVPIMVGESGAMVRPRTGDFLYSDGELEVMLEDIQIFKLHGVRGIVAGILTADGRIDVKRTKTIVDEAFPLEVCFHRAFDMTRDADEALRDIVSIGGISRILTSGRGRSAPGSLKTLERLYRSTKRLAEGSSRPLTVLPGSGINQETVGPMLDFLLPHGLKEVHLSGGSWVDGNMTYKRESMGMGTGGEGEWGIWRTHEQWIRRVKHIADFSWQEFSRSAQAGI